MVGIFILWVGCSKPALEIDGTDYYKICQKAKDNHKDIIVLITSVDCSLCHAILEDSAANREWKNRLKQNLLLCHTDVADSANIFSKILNTMSIPLVIVCSPEQKIKYVHSGFISSARLKKIISDKQVPMSYVDHELYTTSLKRLYQ